MDDNKIRFLALAVVAFVMIAVLCAVLDVGFADPVYVICDPDSFVWMRSAPKFNASELAYLSAGDRLETDWKKSGPWLHVYYQCEVNDGWIHTGYVTYSEPEIFPNGIRAVTDRGKVRARRNAGGKIRKILKKSTDLLAYVISDEWTITNAGFIQTQYLEFYYH